MTRQLTPQDIDYLRAIPEKVRALGMHGLDDVVNAITIALLSDGHVLLEGNPGLGKTALVRALSEAMGLGENAVGRIQFTPDLMPADITGTLMPDEENPERLSFKPGPIFCELLLADEINRATPKTQAAMLEAMAEYQVTVLGESKPLRKMTKPEARPLDDGLPNPFIVMATQNPIDQDGTFNLPEAQSDRFMFKIRMEMPSTDILERIIEKELRKSANLGRDAKEDGGSEKTVPDRYAALERLHDARGAVMSLELPPTVAAHIVNIVVASNQDFGQVTGLSAARLEALKAFVANRVEYPFGPRAGISLAKAALGWAAVVLTDPALADEAANHARKGLAAVIKPVLRHRIRVLHDYSDTDFSASHEADGVDRFLVGLAKATAPDLSIGADASGYHQRFAADLDDADARLVL